MMKLKIFYGSIMEELEQKINAFAASNDVRDIQFESHRNKDGLLVTTAYVLVDAPDFSNWKEDVKHARRK